MTNTTLQKALEGQMMDRARRTSAMIKSRIPAFTAMGYRVEELQVSEMFKGGQWHHELVVNPLTMATPRVLWWRRQWRKVFPYKSKELAW
jgi:hypothetical protein